MGKMPLLSKDLWEAINSIFSSFNIKLNLITETKYVDHVTWWYKLNPLNDQDINFYLPLLALELSIYPKSFIKKLSLQQIIVCHSLSFHTDLYDQYRAAIPDYENPIQGDGKYYRKEFWGKEGSVRSFLPDDADLRHGLSAALCDHQQQRKHDRFHGSGASAYGQRPIS